MLSKKKVVIAATIGFYTLILGCPLNAFSQLGNPHKLPERNLTATTVVTNSKNQETLRDSGTVKAEKRDVKPFTGIIIDGFPGTLRVEVGKPESISITGDSQIIPAISTLTQDNILQISLTKNVVTETNLVIEISIPE